MRPLVLVSIVVLAFGCSSGQQRLSGKSSGSDSAPSHESGGTSSGSDAAAGGTTGSSGSGGGDTGGASVPGDTGGSGGATGGGSSGSGGSSGGGNQVPSNVLTAGAWDDNLNFDFYGRYLAKVEGEQLPGLPLIPRDDRMVVTVTDASGAPVAGAQVVGTHAGATVVDTITGADGRVLVFPTWAGLAHGDALDLTASGNGASAQTSTVAGATTASLQLPAGPPVAALDIAFVVDVTGSMGDELAYLQSEADAIAESIAATYPNVSQRWGLVVYRDRDCDPFVEQHFDFADEATFRTELSHYSADGGCDYPESPDVALKAAAEKLSWRGGATARMLFHVADAPHHAGDEGVVVDDLAELRAKGVHVYPIQASGADELLEFTMRTEAEVTGGSFLFLTDDSGIGDSHEVPTLPCYLVTKLNAAITRMVAMELTGLHLYPTADQVLRTGGDPHDNACQLPDGSTVQVF